MNRCIAKRMLADLLDGILVLVILFLVVSVPLCIMWGFITLAEKHFFGDAFMIGIIVVGSLFVIGRTGIAIKEWYQNARRDCEGK